jgi:hypothetical protein
MSLVDHKMIIDPGILRPYVSLMFLEYTGERETQDFSKLLAFMKGARKDRQRSTYTLLRSGFSDIERFLRSDARPHGADQIDGFIYKLETVPAWAATGAPYTDIRHVLAIVLRRGRMLAISCEQSLRDAIGKWLRREPRPPYRLISQNLIQGAFLRGEAKGLWLHGTHLRSTFRPDTKHIAGIRIDDALNPLDDSSFAMSAAKSRLPEDRTLTALLGIIGTSPRKGTMWNRQVEDFTEFLNAAVEALELIEETLASGALLDRPFPILAVASHDLSGVYGAYDILTLTPDDLPTSTEVSEDMIAAAAVLQRATLNVTGSAQSADFKLDVGLDGSTSGSLKAALRMVDDRVVFTFGYSREPTNPGPVRQILDALEHDDLFAVYYDSGHVVGPQGIGRRNVSPIPFANWRFLDFSGFDIASEKPGITPADIHANTGTPQDVSLFGWAVRHYSSGWLICDDGPGEVADFVHISEDGTLSLVHVKAAYSTSPLRRVAVSAFEVVAGQAVKNSRYLIEPDLLTETLMIPHDPERGAWTDGSRMPDRTEFLTMMGGLMPTDKKEVVIIQPHISESMYQRIRGDEGSSRAISSQELFRLRTLETLLHSARAAAVALGADLHVIASKI